MSKVTLLRPTPQRVSVLHSREQVLGILLPKFLGVLWEFGRSEPGAFPRARAFFGPGPLELGALGLGPAMYCIHVYRPEGPGSIKDFDLSGDSIVTKVFSAHIGDRSVARPEYCNYWDGRCSILSWKRGVWEDAIALAEVEPRSMAHLNTAGLCRASNSAQRS